MQNSDITADREHTCCFTGHRDIPREKKIYRRLVSEVQRLAERGIVNFCCGGALGFDTMGALAVLEVKKTMPELRLIMVLPCKEQERLWSLQDRQEYADILEKADSISYTAEKYFRGCMQMRNRRLVDSSSVCLCCLTRSTGGTAYTVKYAQKQGLEIINIAED